MSFSCSMLGSNLKHKMGVMWNMICRAVYSTKIEREQLKPGDHIYTWRSGYSYSHHGLLLLLLNYGIYVGDGKVIHLTRAPGLIIFSSSGAHPSGDRVVCCSIEEFLSGGDLYLFEYGVSPILFLIKHRGSSTIASSDPPEDVVHRASFLLEYGFGSYNLYENNCEDFALYCKTGLLDFIFPSDERIAKSGTSRQIAFIQYAIGTLSIIPYRFLPHSFIVLVILVCGLYGRILYSNDLGVGNNFEKVAAEKFDHINYERTVRDIREKARRRYFSRGKITIRCLLLTYWLLLTWLWTPEIQILKFVRILLLAFITVSFDDNIPRNYGLKVGYRTILIVFIAVYYYKDILLWLASSL
ncbi:hypothetical protein FNV43_RR25098 [Rhamnella rubrinervis]|uniref:LRAT domain-containing protein n=1 Tax=Rhamnella rubrinervis TaxID=2594499 RepID=A0A8K0DUF4_9ROSA|nr:hypothetical protein FNV43_RR25098 [Rhamnella rubrinervis]